MHTRSLPNLIDSTTCILNNFNLRSHKLTDERLQMLYECEEERMVYKACLREVIGLKRKDKHTSWNTADISALYLS